MPPDNTFAQLPREAGAVRPRNAAEHHPYALVMAAITSGAGIEYASAADFGTEFRARLRARRRQG
ncbi:hypothetical protein MAFF211479_39150 (plasmid) [Ralstonia solanacearum]|nr:hypothetical protein MAFF211479_39150 [Ralstonia solanacearum]BCL99364.1 hypothetical protein MAFF211491_38160 [Ralstonia solanacearum]BCM14841.1 hypothetical protein MAFF241648_40310 [Ralstonia solanacearum]BCN11945.1 hypothetical protein RPSD_38300 [Ralstonia solanacearum]